jgi:DoxX-like family
MPHQCALRRQFAQLDFPWHLSIVSTGATKLLAHETIDFFHASGYSTAFFFFIATWELVSGLGLAFRRTVFFALIALSIDMFGAIYTHFHNYLTRGFPGQLGNSLDALRMLFLMTYIGFGLQKQLRRDELSRAAAQHQFTD